MYINRKPIYFTTLQSTFCAYGQSRLVFFPDVLHHRLTELVCGGPFQSYLLVFIT